MERTLDPKEARAFTSALFAWYERHGRTHLPWRRDPSPYHVIVSETMLQQTQVDRVIPLYEAFLAAFPDFAALASASRADVLRLWKGLGYNSRAVRLHELSRRVLEYHGGELPRDPELLRALPGVGPYTLAAILAFAYNEPAVAFDTNLRRIVHRVGWGVEHPYLAPLGAIEDQAARLLNRRRSREWNSAMMDLGATLCTARAPKCLLCPLQKLCRAAPVDAASLAIRARAATKKGGPQAQLRFEETTRYARGRIIDRLRALPAGERISFLDLHDDLRPQLGGRDEAEIDRIVTALVQDGLVDHNERGVCLHGA